jgi:beta-lactamase class D
MPSASRHAAPFSVLSLIAGLLITGPARSASSPPEKIVALFDNNEGCFLLRQLDGPKEIRAGGALCSTPLSPCSTFKVPNSLIGLSTGAIEDAETSFKWDGSKQHFKIWEQDHTLRTAFANSVVWYYQRLAEKIGRARMQEVLRELPYGSQEIGDKLTTFWLDGTLTITAEQQLEFMSRLYQGKLPFSRPAVETVKGFMDGPFDGERRFGGKTGTDMVDGKLTLGWFVGHLTSGDHEYVLVTLLRAEDGASGQKARKVSELIVRALGL